MTTVPGTLYIISAPSGAGKSSLIQAMLNSDLDLGVSISYTTRPQRPGEANGQHYHFIDQATFDDMLGKGEFLEHAKVFDYSYGTSETWVREQIQNGKDILIEIDWQGAQQVRKLFPDHNVSIYILPPNLESLHARLIKRKRDPQEVIDKRMQQAVSEMTHYDEYDYLILNDNFEEAMADLKAILTSKRLRLNYQRQHYQHLIEALLVYKEGEKNPS